MGRRVQVEIRPEENGMRTEQKGFTLMELAVATVVLLVGAVAVMQLVPAALQTNLYNRVDTSSVVIAQRELDQMEDQPLTAVTFTDADGNLCNLGNPGAAGTTVTAGAALVAGSSPAAINYTAAQVGGYSFNFTNPQDPTDGVYDVRWSVTTTTNAAGTVTSKRFIVGAWRRVSVQQLLPPVTIDSWQQLSR